MMASIIASLPVAISAAGSGVMWPMVAGSSRMSFFEEHVDDVHQCYFVVGDLRRDVAHRCREHLAFMGHADDRYHSHSG